MRLTQLMVNNFVNLLIPKAARIDNPNHTIVIYLLGVCAQVHDDGIVPDIKIWPRWG